MIRRIRSFTIKMVAGANFATIILMLAAGYSDRIDPADHPVMACMGLAFPVFAAANLMFLLAWLTVSMRHAIIAIAGFCLALPPIRLYMPVNAGSDTPEDAIKVMTYNVFGFAGQDDNGDSTRKIVDYILDTNADIVCLQEDTGNDWTQRGRLEERYKHRDRQTIGKRKGNKMSIYSRYPIIRKDTIGYESDNNGSVAYILDIGGRHTVVVNNHLESTHLSPKDRSNYKELLKGEMHNDTAKTTSKLLIGKLAEATRIRAAQAKAVARYIRMHDGMPVIVCGDFNDSPISYTRRTIAATLTDCYEATGCGPGVSYNQKGFFVRIDNILCSKHFTPYNCQVDNNMEASDHYPVICSLKYK